MTQGQNKSTHVELARKRCEARLAIDTGKNVQRELLGAFDDDLLAFGIPANHVLILLFLEQATEAKSRKGTMRFGEREDLRVEFCEEGGRLSTSGIVLVCLTLVHVIVLIVGLVMILRGIMVATRAVLGRGREEGRRLLVLLVLLMLLLLLLLRIT